MKLIFIAAAATVAWAQQSGAPDDFRISTNVDLVMLDVSVKDTANRFIAGLKQSDFHILDNGKPQEVRYFGNADLPVTLGLVIDNSGSMARKRATVDQSAVALIRASNPHDEIFPITFNDKVHFGLPPDQPFSDQIPVLIHALAQGESQGRTQLYGGIAAALKHVQEGQNGRKALVVISDGGDNASAITWPGLKEMVQSSNASIYTIGVFDSDDPDRKPAALRQLAELTGGEYFFVNDLFELQGVCENIAHDIRNRYMVAFTPPANTRPSVHRLKVAVTVPAADGRVVVRTRADYRSKPDWKTSAGAQ